MSSVSLTILIAVGFLAFVFLLMLAIYANGIRKSRDDDPHQIPDGFPPRRPFDTPVDSGGARGAVHLPVGTAGNTVSDLLHDVEK